MLPRLALLLRLLLLGVENGESAASKVEEAEATADDELSDPKVNRRFSDPKVHSLLLNDCALLA